MMGPSLIMDRLHGLDLRVRKTSGELRAVVPPVLELRAGVNRGGGITFAESQ